MAMPLPDLTNGRQARKIIVKNEGLSGGLRNFILQVISERHFYSHFCIFKMISCIYVIRRRLTEQF